MTKYIVDGRTCNESTAVMFRVGLQLGTTIYRGKEAQPCAWVPGDPDLAKIIVSLLNKGRNKEIA